MAQRVAVVPGLSGSWSPRDLERAVRRAGGEPVVTRTMGSIRRAAEQGMPVVSYSSGSAIAEVALEGIRGAKHVEIAPFGGRTRATEVVSGSRDFIAGSRRGDTIAHGKGHFGVVESREAVDAIGRAIGRSRR